MFPLQNKHTEVLGAYCDEPFKGTFVDEVIGARDSVFDEIRQEIGVDQFEEIRAEYFQGKRGITKEKLISWLETVCCILDNFAVPLLEKGVDLFDNVEKFKDEKIEDQKSIIELQQKLILKKEEELITVQTTVQNTVQAEMKTYSSVVSKSCNAALASKKIQAAVRKVAQKDDTRRRKMRNFMTK